MLRLLQNQRPPRVRIGGGSGINRTEALSKPLNKTLRIVVVAPRTSITYSSYAAIAAVN
jgi:hypothetical protein